VDEDDRDETRALKSLNDIAVVGALVLVGSPTIYDKEVVPIFR